jgi:hypothetical protein
LNNAGALYRATFLDFVILNDCLSMKSKERSLLGHRAPGGYAELSKYDAAAIVAISPKIILVHYIGVSGIVLATIVAYMICVILQFYFLHHKLVA